MDQLPTPPPSPTLKDVCVTPESRIGQILPCGVQLTGVLGVGAYGVVYLAKDGSGTSFAVKVLNKTGLGRRQKKFLHREIELHQKASSHPNVVSLIDVIHTEDCIYVVLEYCPEGDLFGNITEHGRYVGNDPLAKRVFLQLLDAVESCHSVGIYHRDLKPENVLVTDSGLTAKLADFGLASTDSCSSDFGCGSTFYMSPECLQDAPKDFSCYASAPNDVWSLGVILCNLVSGRNPWKKASVDDPTFAAFLRDSEFLKSILPITDELDWILRCVFECDPSRRVTIAQLRRMIIGCAAFTSSPGSTVGKTEAYGSCFDVTSQVQLPALVPGMQAAARPTFSQFSEFSASSGSSGSDSDWQMSTPPSPYSLSPSTTLAWPADYSHAGYDQQTLSSEQYPPKSHQISTPPNAWFAPFITPALDLAQKHMSLQPFFPGVRLF